MYVVFAEACPLALMAFLAAWLLWAGRLSRMTTLPLDRVGASWLWTKFIVPITFVVMVSTGYS